MFELDIGVAVQGHSWTIRNTPRCGERTFTTRSIRHILGEVEVGRSHR